MCPKTIVVHIPRLQTAEHLLAAAAVIAARDGGHVVALVILPPVVVIPTAIEDQAAPIVLDTARRSAEGLATALRPVVAAAAAKGRCTIEIAVADAADSSPGQVLIERAMAADLVVVERHRIGWSRLEFADAPDSVALGCGRPVIVMPDAISGTAPTAHFGRRVLVAWDGSREASRALFDALPLLRTADAVRIAWIAPEADPYLAEGEQPADVTAMLTRRGIACDTYTIVLPQGLSGRAILEASARFDADLLVMGCFGHSPLREFVLGGVSRHVLEQATIPVLLSH